jgi:hypothetical protein
MLTPRAALDPRARFALASALASAMAGVLGLAGCEHPTSPPPPSVAGVYTLRTVDGGPLPWLFGYLNGERVETVGEVLTLNADSTFTKVLVSRRTAPNGASVETTRTNGGRWSLAYPSLTLQRSDGGNQYGDFRGPQALALGIVAPLFVYHRAP